MLNSTIASFSIQDQSFYGVLLDCPGNSEVLNRVTNFTILVVLPSQNCLFIENRVISYSNLVSPMLMHSLTTILKILTFNTFGY